MLPADMRGQLEKFVDDGSTNINRWIARDAILETACHYYYAKGDGGPVLSPGNWLRGDWLRDATVDHLCLAGYSEPVVKKIVSTAGAPLALASVKWARDAFQKKLETYPKLSPKRTETWKLTRKGLRIALMCMLDGMVGRAKENHLSQNLIRVSLRVQGYNLPKTPNLQTRVAIIGFLEAAQISLETMPHELVK